MVLVGACTSDVRVDPAASSAKDCRSEDDEILGCCRAGDACTFAAPVGGSCTDAFTSFCAHGLGWCEDTTCRAFCNPVATPRCDDGLVEQHGPIADLGDADQCLCVPQ